MDCQYHPIAVLQNKNLSRKFQNSVTPFVQRGGGVLGNKMESSLSKR